MAFTFITLDSLVNGSANWFFEFIIGFLFIEVLPMMWQIIAAPFTNPQMMWIVTPLLIAMTLMQLYFARHREEELGWSSAFGNSISLIFVSINLLQFFYNQYGFAGLNIFNPINSKIYLVLGIGLISIIQLLINFFHMIPKKIAFFVNSSIPTNMTAYVAIVIVYTAIPLTLSTLFGALLLLALLIYLFKFIKGLIPMSKEAVYHIKMKEEEDARQRAWHEKVELRQERSADAQLSDALISIAIIVAVFFAMLVLKTFFIIPLLVTLLVQGGSFLMVVVILLLGRRLSIYNLNFDGESKELLLGVILGFLLLILISGLIYAFWFFVPQIDKMELLIPSYAYQDVNPWLLLLILGLLIPISVELLFRGVIQRSLRGKIGRHPGVIIQALLFSLIAFSFSLIDGFPNPFLALTVPVLFVGGLLLGYMRDKWGLDSSLSAHITFNIIGLIMFFVTI